MRLREYAVNDVNVCAEKVGDEHGVIVRAGVCDVCHGDDAVRGSASDVVELEVIEALGGEQKALGRFRVLLVKAAEDVRVGGLL